MMNSSMNRLKWFVGLVLLQGLIIGQIQAARIALPLVYILFILKLPSDIGRKQLLLYAFAIGLFVDIFGNTPGMNASASLWLAMARPTLLRWQTGHDAAEYFVPKVRTMGLGPYFRYIVPAVILHASVLNIIDTFSSVRINEIVMGTLSDSAVTIVLFLLIELIGRKD